MLTVVHGSFSVVGFGPPFVLRTNLNFAIVIVKIDR